MCKVSVIVPIYNVEDYLEECIESILNQTLESFELILIDDGSTDSSSTICDIYEKKDKRIKVVHKVNGGLSSARNRGLEIATGEYVAFVDSDDFIKLNTAYEDMYNIAINEESDIVSGNALWYYSDENNYPMHKDMNMFLKSPIDSEKFFINCMKSNRLYAPVWTNLYKRKTLIDNNILFKEGIFHEDEEFTPRVLLKAETVSIYNEEFYVYRQRENSITNSSLNYKKGKDVLDICLILEDNLKEIKSEELRELFKKYLTQLVIDQIYKYRFYDVTDNIKSFINRNAITSKQKIRIFLININVGLYIKCEKIIKYLKDKVSF